MIKSDLTLNQYDIRRRFNLSSNKFILVNPRYHEIFNYLFSVRSLQYNS